MSLADDARRQQEARGESDESVTREKKKKICDWKPFHQLVVTFDEKGRNTYKYLSMVSVYFQPLMKQYKHLEFWMNIKSCDRII